MSGLDWKLGLGRRRSLELLWLMLLIVMVLLLMKVHPRGGAIGVMRESVTSWQVNGSQNDRLTCLIGTRSLWTSGSCAG